MTGIVLSLKERDEIIDEIDSLYHQLVYLKYEEGLSEYIKDTIQSTRQYIKDILYNEYP